MEFNIKQNARGYYIHTNISNNDINIATLLDIPFKKYKNLLIKYKAFHCHDGYYFYTPQDVQNFLNSDELLPYITMTTLTE